MNREVFYYVINNHQYYYFALIGLVFLFNWLLLFKIALLLNKIDLRWGQILPWVIPGIIYSMIGKCFIPQEYFGVFVIVIFIITLFIVGKLTLIKSLLTSVFTFFFSALGPILVGPFIHYNQKMIIFFFETPQGSIVGGLTETVFPLLLFNFLKYNKFLATKKLRRSEFFEMLILSVLLVAIYFLTTQYGLYITNASNYSFLSFFLLELFLVSTALLAFFFKHHASKREEEKRLREHLQQQLELCSTLVESLSGEQREFKNQLQVLKGLVELGQKEKFNGFIDQITAQMLDTTMLDFDNPILASALLEAIIQARELGIGIKIQVALSLKDLHDPFKVGRALKLVINYFLNNRAMRREREKEVTVLIEQVESYYQFTVFYRNNSIISVREVAAASENQNLQKVETIIKELYGKFSYGYSAQDLTRISFKIPASIY